MEGIRGMGGRIAALACITALALGLAGCGSTTATPPAGETGTTTNAPVEKPADLEGTWKQTNSKSTDSWMEATISGDTIEVYWMGADTKSLYWKGTYQKPDEPGDWTWTSQGDTEAMASSLLASQDSSKRFSYSKAKGIQWEVTALGSTVTVETARK